MELMSVQYLLKGFKSLNEAENRSAELLIEKSGEDSLRETKYLCGVVAICEHEWGLIINEEDKKVLSTDEQDSLIKLELPVAIYTKPYFPVVYRYLKRQHVDEFFATGKLRLSSFKKFSQHENESLNDDKEGSAITQVRGKDFISMEVSSSGHCSYVLCSSLVQSDRMFDVFNGADSCIVITNPQEFINEVFNQLTSVTLVEFGPCAYKPKRVVEKQSDLTKETTLSKGIYPNNSAGVDPSDRHFLKLDKHSEEHEYRMIWHVNSDDHEEVKYIYLNNPEEYCKRWDRE